MMSHRLLAAADSDADSSSSVSAASASALQSQLSALHETLNRRTRELDAAQSACRTQCGHLRSMLAASLLRAFVRSHRAKRQLMSLHLTTMEMRDALQREKQRRARRESAAAAAASGASLSPSSPTSAADCDAQPAEFLYDDRKQPSKATLRKLAHLYRQRIVRVVAELDERLSQDVKPAFLLLLQSAAAASRENETLFLRNVALTNEMMECRQQAADDRRERERWEKEAKEQRERGDRADEELQQLRRRVRQQEREEESRRRREAAAAVQRRQEKGKAAFSSKLGLDAEEKDADSDGDELRQQEAAVSCSPSASALPSLTLRGSGGGGSSAASPKARQQKQQRQSGRSVLTVSTALSDDGGSSRSMSPPSGRLGFRSLVSPYAASAAAASPDSPSASTAALPSLAAPSARRAASSRYDLR